MTTKKVEEILSKNKLNTKLNLVVYNRYLMCSRTLIRKIDKNVDEAAKYILDECSRVLPVGNTYMYSYSCLSNKRIIELQKALIKLIKEKEGYKNFSISDITGIIKISFKNSLVLLLSSFDNYNHNINDVELVTFLIYNDNGWTSQFQLIRKPNNCGACQITSFEVNSYNERQGIGNCTLKLAEAYISEKCFSLVECSGKAKSIDTFLLKNGYTKYALFTNPNSGNQVGHYFKNLNPKTALDAKEEFDWYKDDYEDSDYDSDANEW